MSDGLAEQIDKLVVKIAERAPDPACASSSLAAGDALIDELLYVFLHWEAGSEHATGAMERLASAFVDVNELRVCHPSEVASILGVRYPKGLERSERLAAALRGIYDRENVLGLESLREMSKRDARGYLESLAGVPRFVAARVLLLRLEGHAMPVDARLLAMLRGEKVQVGTNDPDEACGKLERAVRAADARDVYLALEHHCEHGVRPRPKGRTRKAASGS